MPPFPTMLHGGGVELHGDPHPIQFQPGAGLTHDQKKSHWILIGPVLQPELLGRFPRPGRRLPLYRYNCRHGSLMGGVYLHCIGGRD